MWVIIPISVLFYGVLKEFLNQRLSNKRESDYFIVDKTTKDFKEYTKKLKYNKYLVMIGAVFLVTFLVFIVFGNINFYFVGMGLILMYCHLIIKFNIKNRFYRRVIKENKRGIANNFNSQVIFR